MRPDFIFSLGRLHVLRSGRLESDDFIHLGWLLYWAKKRRRVTGADPKRDQPCDWCKQVNYTTVEEIWSRAYPEGDHYRLCQNCLSGCAGG